MQYRLDKHGNRISVLGYGCMRFPKTVGVTDMKAVNEQLMAAYRAGINYYDTAYIYPGSEAALGEVLEKNGIRNEVYIATKLPHYLIKSMDGLEKLFREQLRRLRTDRIDYYLMHMLSDTRTWQRLKDMGIEDWLAQKRAEGSIRQVGFSYHGNSETFCDLLDAYDWDFTQIQYNYLDEHAQAGRRGLHRAYEKGIPVIIMEPLRGGKLANRLPEEAKRIFDSHTPHRTPADWALRWLWDQPQVTCVLSGMNTLETVQANVATADAARTGELTAEDRAMLQRVVSAINAKTKVGCTGCGYCMPCPKNVDIPGTFAAYNRRYGEGKFNAFTEYAMCTALRRDSAAASQCIGCGKCESHCPQHLPIRQHLRAAQKELEGPVYKALRKTIEVFKLF